MDESDKKWIDENVKEESAENPEPLPWEKKPMIRYQWSDKIGNQIFVVETTGEPLETFIEKVKDVQNQYGLGSTAPQPPYVPPTPTAVQPSQVCNICGTKAYLNEGVSKAGRPYKIFKCSKFPELQKNNKGVVGHSYFM